jgi:hypothetical protein
MTPLAVLLVALAVTVLWLAWKTAAASAKRKATRAGYFDAVVPLFDRVTMRIEPTGFPRMTGHIGGQAFDLQTVQDSLTFRKLPVLWVMLTLTQTQPVKASLHVMARPAGNEPFSHFARMPHSLPTPATLPEGTSLRSEDAANIPPEALLAQHFGIFADPKVKEMVISPKGLRLVILADEAERGRYLIFREAELGQTPLRPERLTPLMDTLLALRQTLTEAP